LLAVSPTSHTFPGNTTPTGSSRCLNARTESADAERAARSGRACIQESVRPIIAIIGAGPGGLTAARDPRRHGFPVTIYERDASSAARDQGRTLDMQSNSGQIALAAAGLLDEFFARARPKGQDIRIADRHGTIGFEHRTAPDELGNPEIDRGDLRHLPLASLEPGTIAYGKTRDAARPLGDGRHELTFRDGATATVDLLIGADGARSKVRPLLSPAQPVYSGILLVESRIGDIDTAHPALAALVGNGSFSAYGEGKGLIAQRNARGVVRIYATFAAPHDWAASRGLAPNDPEAFRTTLLALYAGWAPELRALLAACDATFIPRPIFALPVPHTWESRPGVTLLGDAAHLLSPATGQGANSAMRDAAALAAAPDLPAAVARYEALMLPRAAEHAAEAGEALANHADPDGPRGLLAQFAALFG